MPVDRADYLKALETRGPRLAIEIEVLKSATPRERERLFAVNPALREWLAREEHQETT